MHHIHTGVELSRLQGNVGKQRKEEKCPDTGGTRTHDSGSRGSSLNHQTTSASLVVMITMLNASHTHSGKSTEVHGKGCRTGFI